MRTAQTLAVFALIGAATVPAFAFQEAPELPGTMDVSRVSGGTYETDPNHTLVAWTVNHFGFNDYFGAFGDVEGTLTIDPANPDDAMVDVSIPIDSVTVVSQGLHDHLLRAGKDGAEPDFFGPDAGMARFVSTDVDVAASGTEAQISGHRRPLYRRGHQSDEQGRNGRLHGHREDHALRLRDRLRPSRGLRRSHAEDKRGVRKALNGTDIVRVAARVRPLVARQLVHPPGTREHARATKSQSSGFPASRAER